VPVLVASYHYGTMLTKTTPLSYLWQRKNRKTSGGKRSGITPANNTLGTRTVRRMPRVLSTDVYIGRPAQKGFTMSSQVVSDASREQANALHVEKETARADVPCDANREAVKMHQSQVRKARYERDKDVINAHRRQIRKAYNEANRDAIDAHRTQVRAIRAAARKAIKAQSNG